MAEGPALLGRAAAIGVVTLVGVLDVWSPPVAVVLDAWSPPAAVVLDAWSPPADG
ncbi:hypothetical protein [Streptomyces sp. NPDC053367]|uniref:hypothetical protein n=1 Tax=Streptomyces sp. NPDC053367 TaxID=3365700 RepID=UPI0037D8EBCA